MKLLKLHQFWLPILALGLMAFAKSQQMATQVELILLSPPGQPVGSTILWQTVVEESQSDNLVYRFSVGPLGQPLMVVKDFSTWDIFEWTPMEEGIYRIEVAVKDLMSSETISKTRFYFVTRRGSGKDPVITSTEHPLVALFSTPPCQGFGYIRIRYRPKLAPNWNFTPWKLCRFGKSMNFYVAGMLANTTYEMQSETYANFKLERGPGLRYTTETPDLAFPSFAVHSPPDHRSSLLDGIILHSYSLNGGEFLPVATDLSGNVVWYYDKLRASWHFGSYLTNPLPGGTMLLILNDYTIDGVIGQVLREIDLAGNVLRETNVPRINEQLLDLGQDPILTFHHEATRLPNGQTILFGAVEHILTDQQGSGDVHVVGDMVIALDENWQVSWTWNSFDHLDISRPAVLGEQCSTVTDGCLMNFGYMVNDWTHSNTIAYSSKDGHLLLSLRNQDWVIKIAYQDGEGSGDILWRFGLDGDFTVQSNVPTPWFSHQHGVILVDNNVLLFDNGNTRCESSPTPPDCHSRGQVWGIDEQNKVATLKVNADLGGYSSAYGWSQILSNGNYSFTSSRHGPFWDGYSQVVEVLPDGEINYILESTGWLYRSFRMKSLYNPGPGPLMVDDLDLPGDEPIDNVYLPLIVITQ